MNRAQIRVYDSERELADKPFSAACYAPFASMYFNVHGDVIACCQNTRHVLGNIADESLVEIWRGEPARVLREALRAYDLSRGCEFCQWQVDDGNLAGMFATSFDELFVDPASDGWPSQLEFAMSNACNLECVMCHGEFSSSIRAHREHMPPLPSRYGDPFFEQIGPFLAHARGARFFGGEPFLARENFRLWDLMVTEGHEVECRVTTNGTQWSDRIAALLDALPFTIGISMDGLTPETVEAVRLRARHDEIMANFRRFHGYSQARGRPLSLTYCLMVPNWHEFGDFLRFADEWDCPVFVNTVIYPENLSLYRLPSAALDVVLDALSREGESLHGRLVRNSAVWETELTRLRNWRGRLDARAAGSGGRHLYFEGAVEGAPHGPESVTLRPGGIEPPDGDAQDAEAANPLPSRFDPSHGVLLDPEAAIALLADEQWLDPPSVLRLDADGCVVAAEAGVTFLGIALGGFTGRPFGDLLQALEAQFGSAHRVVWEQVDDWGVQRSVLFEPDDGSVTEFRVVVIPNRDRSGTVDGSTTFAERIAVGRFTGRGYDGLLRALEAQYGSAHRVLWEQVDHGGLQRSVLFEPDDGDRKSVV